MKYNLFYSHLTGVTLPLKSNKTVLCERKRHTARRVASTRSAVLSQGVLHPVLARALPWGTCYLGLGYLLPGTGVPAT